MSTLDSLQNRQNSPYLSPIEKSAYTPVSVLSRYTLSLLAVENDGCLKKTVKAILGAAAHTVLTLAATVESVITGSLYLVAKTLNLCLPKRCSETTTQIVNTLYKIAHTSTRMIRVNASNIFSVSRGKDAQLTLHTSQPQKVEYPTQTHTVSPSMDNAPQKAPKIDCPDKPKSTQSKLANQLQEHAAQLRNTPTPEIRHPRILSLTETQVEEHNRMLSERSPIQFSSHNSLNPTAFIIEGDQDLKALTNYYHKSGARKTYKHYYYAGFETGQEQGIEEGRKQIKKSKRCCCFF